MVSTDELLVQARRSRGSTQMSSAARRGGGKFRQCIAPIREPLVGRTATTPPERCRRSNSRPPTHPAARYAPGQGKARAGTWYSFSYLRIFCCWTGLRVKSKGDSEEPFHTECEPADRRSRRNNSQSEAVLTRRFSR